jgi:glycosyltransferase involved in cell wall biosynthesis
MTLTIAHVNAEMGFSGGEVQVFLLMEGLRERGHRNVLFCRPGSRCEQECRRRGFDARLVRMRNYLDAPAVPALARGYRDVSADLVQTHSGRDTWLGGLAARRAGLPAVSVRRQDRRVKRGWHTRLLYGRLLTRVVAISPAVADCLADGGVPRDVVELIAEAVDPERIRPVTERDAVREALGVDRDELLLLGVGALNARKGWDVLLDALAGLESRLRDALAVRIAGEGPERGALGARADRIAPGGRVRLLGPRDDVADLLGACDVFVMPSRREGLGVACLEAMGAGRPVVASRVGGLAHSVVHDATGLLVPPGEPAALAEALTRLLGDAALRRRLGEAGRARAEARFAPAPMVEAYLRVYRQVLAEHVARPQDRG